jgi:hypothetical protein
MELEAADADAVDIIFTCQGFYNVFVMLFS